LGNYTRLYIRKDRIEEIVLQTNRVLQTKDSNISIILKNSFVQSDAEPYLLPGNSSISGQAFFRTAGGEVKTSAGLTVQLYPATPYFLERHSAWDANFVKSYLPSNAGAFIKEVTCDANGNFEFVGLPSGDYLLRCYIKWLVGNNSSSGGTVRSRVTVGEGESKKVLLTQ
jgi:hypothetical protein